MSAAPPMQSSKAAGGTLIVTGSFAANDTAGTRVNCNLQFDPSLSATQFLIVPDSEFWLIVDLWVRNATDHTTHDAEVEFYKDQDRIMDRSRPLSSAILSSAQRANGLNTNLGYQGGSHMTVKAVALETSATAGNLRAYAPYEKHA